MQRTNIYLEERQCEVLDRLAAEEGIPRAQLIRRIIDAALSSADASLEGDLDAIESSFGVLVDAEPPDREPDARSAHLDRMWRLGS